MGRRRRSWPAGSGRGRRGVAGTYRGELPTASCEPLPDRDAAAVAGGRGGTAGRSGAGVAGGAAPRDRGRGGEPGGCCRVARDRRPGAVPPSAACARPCIGRPRAGERRTRTAFWRTSPMPRLIPIGAPGTGPGGAAAGRGRRGGSRALGGPGAGAWRPGRGRRVLATSCRADARAGASSGTRIGRGARPSTRLGCRTRLWDCCPWRRRVR